MQEVKKEILEHLREILDLKRVQNEVYQRIFALGQRLGLGCGKSNCAQYGSWWRCGKRQGDGQVRFCADCFPEFAALLKSTPRKRKRRLKFPGELFDDIMKVLAQPLQP